MKIKYLGHSSFLITSNKGTRILTDPYDPDKYEGELLFAKITEQVDIVTVSHGHRDHGEFVYLPGAPVVIKGNGLLGADDVRFLGVETFHDEVHGEKRGKNTVIVMETEGIRIAHLGDLGHILTSDQAAEIGAVDVALVPVGGYYTIDAEQASKVADQLGAKIVIPMHYRSDKCLFSIAGVDEFLQGKTNVTRAGVSEIEVNKDTLPKCRQIVVLEPSL